MNKEPDFVLNRNSFFKQQKQYAYILNQTEEIILESMKEIPVKRLFRQMNGKIGKLHIIYKISPNFRLLFQPDKDAENLENYAETVEKLEKVLDCLRRLDIMLMQYLARRDLIHE